MMRDVILANDISLLMLSTRYENSTADIRVHNAHTRAGLFFCADKVLRDAIARALLIQSCSVIFIAEVIILSLILFAFSVHNGD